MPADIVKSSIDLGIVVRDAEKSLHFYRDTLGLAEEGAMPMGGGTVMHRLLAGDSVIKLLAFAEVPSESAPPGGLAGASGYRYWTITVSNLDEAVAGCTEAGYNAPWSPREIRPGVRIAMVEDPDGNWVELLELSDSGA